AETPSGLFVIRQLDFLRHSSLPAHLSHSPITKSRLPSTAGTSLTRQPGRSSCRILRFTKDGARIFSRYGTPPPLLLMQKPSSPLGFSAAKYTSPTGASSPSVTTIK